MRDVDRVVGLLGNRFRPQLIINRLRPQARSQRARCSRSRTSTAILRLPLLGVIADEPEIIVTTNRGEPLALRRGDSDRRGLSCDRGARRRRRRPGADAAGAEGFVARAPRLDLRRQARDDRVSQAALRPARVERDREGAFAARPDDRSSGARARDDRSDEARSRRRDLALRRGRPRTDRRDLRTARSHARDAGEHSDSLGQPPQRQRYRKTRRGQGASPSTAEPPSERRCAAADTAAPAASAAPPRPPRKRKRRKKTPSRGRSCPPPRSEVPSIWRQPRARDRSERYLRNFNWPLAAAGVLIAFIGILCIRSAGLHAPGAAGEYQKQILYLVLGVPVMSASRSSTIARGSAGRRDSTSSTCCCCSSSCAADTARWARSAGFRSARSARSSRPSRRSSSSRSRLRRCSAADVRELLELWKPLLAVAVPALLILKQPDLGTSLVLLAILTVELFFALPKVGDFGIYALGVLVVAAAALGTNAAAQAVPARAALRLPQPEGRSARRRL